MVFALVHRAIFTAAAIDLSLGRLLSDLYYKEQKKGLSLDRS